MIINETYLNKVLDLTLLEYSKKIYPIKNVKIRFISKLEFLRDAKNDSLIQKYIQLGVYKDFDNEYPNFLVVYVYDKSSISLILTGNYYISVCLDIAIEKLNPFSTGEISNYLKHLFAHEITHILEDTLKDKYYGLWKKSLQSTKNDIGLAHELFAEEIASIISNEKEYKNISDKLWGFINDRIYKIK